MRAVVWDGKIDVRDDVQTTPVGPREVGVRIHRAGLCHSDVSVMNGTIPFPTPVVLGHEGAGVVTEVGSAVTAVRPGEHVVLTTLGNCGQCAACERGRPTQCHAPVGGLRQRFTVDNGRPVNQFANVGVFAERTVVHETQAVVIDPELPMDVACLIGCAMLTGAGAVFNRARVHPGSTVLVIGAGGIGQSVIQAARLCAARRIVVVDTNPGKEGIARTFGATDFVDAAVGGDIVSAVQQLGISEGVDYAFECVGHPDLIRHAVDLLGVGGTCVLLGVPERRAEASFQVSSLYTDKAILGCRYGTARPHHDIPLIVGLCRQGRFQGAEMVSQVYRLADIELAARDLAEGTLNRGVLRTD